MKKAKLLVIGHGRHGKDTVSEILCQDFKLSFISSSMFACKKFIYNDLKEKYNYKSFEECYADRHNHRAEWYGAISGYCVADPAKLGKDIFAGLKSIIGGEIPFEGHLKLGHNVEVGYFAQNQSEHLPPEKTVLQIMEDAATDGNRARVRDMLGSFQACI